MKNPMTGRVGVKKEKGEKLIPVEIKEEVVTDGVGYENKTEFDITVSKESLVTESESNELAPRCSFNYSNLKQLSDNRILNDNIINTVQKMLKKQFSQATGLQDSVLGQTLNFNLNRNLPFAQVLHHGGLPWIAVSTFHSNEREINLMDSLFNRRVSDNSKQQIYALLNCRNKNIKINVLPVQQQKHGVDCGLFPLTFSSEVLLLLFCISLSSIMFIISDTYRHHLLS